MNTAPTPLQQANRALDVGDAELARELVLSLPTRSLTAEQAIEAADILALGGYFQDALELLQSCQSGPHGGPLLEDEIDVLRSVQSVRPDEPLVDPRVELAAVERTNAPAAPDRETGAVEACRDDVSSSPTDAQHGDLARLLALFAGREGVYARQWASEHDNGYAPVRQPLSPSILAQHVAGEVTIGVYPLRADGTVRFVAFDVDITKAALLHARDKPKVWQGLRARLHTLTTAVVRRLRDIGVASVVADSGRKGRHVYVFLNDAVPASEAVAFGAAVRRGLIEPGQELDIEVFPKQSRVTASALGNLLKLPLGVHRVSGRRCALLLEDGTPDPSPWSTLRNVQRVSAAQWREGLRLMGVPNAPAAAVGSPGGESRAQVEAPGQQVMHTTPATVANDSPPNDRKLMTDVSLVDAVLAGCSVTRSIAESAQAGWALSHDERVVLRQALARDAAGTAFVEALFTSAVGTPAHEFGHSPCSGAPISCAGVRRRVPGRAASEACYCSFTCRGTEYPSPVLHGAAASPARPSAGAAIDTTSGAMNAAHEVAEGHVETGAQHRAGFVPSARRPLLPSADPTGQPPAASGLAATAMPDSAAAEVDERSTHLALLAAVRAQPGRRLMTDDGIWSLHRRGMRELLSFSPVPS